MPKIPQRESTQDIVTTSPIARRSPDVASVSGRITQEIGDTLSTVATQFQKVKSLQEVTQADTESRRRLSELQLEASTDPDIWDENKYRERISKIQNESNKGISLPIDKEAFNNKYQSNAIVADFNIRKIMRNRQIEVSHQSMFDNIDTMEEGFVNASTPDEQYKAQVDLGNLIRANVQGGIVDAKAGKKLEEDTIKKWNNSWIDSDIEIDADSTLAELEAGKNGIYGNVDSTIRVKKANDARLKIKRNAEIADLRQAIDFDASENNMTTMILNNETTEADIDKAELRGQMGQENGISSEYATIARRAIKSSKNIDPVEQVDVYNDLIDRFFKTGITATGKGKGEASKGISLGEIANFRTDVMQAWSDGKITEADAKSWLELTAATQNEELKGIAAQKFTNGKAVNDFLNWGSKRLPKEQQRQATFEMSKELMNILSQGDIPDKDVPLFAQGILQNWIRRNNPSILGLSDVPNNKGNQVDGITNLMDNDNTLSPTRAIDVKNILGGFTEQDIIDTAEAEGMTVEEVKNKLGILNAKESDKGTGSK